MGQINGLQFDKQVSGCGPEVIAAQVQEAPTGQCVVDEGGAFQPVGRQVQEAQVPLVRRVILAQRLQAGGRGMELPEGARQDRRANGSAGCETNRGSVNGCTR